MKPKSLKKDLGYTDKQKFAEYFDSIRTVETQMDRLEKMKAEPPVARRAKPTFGVTGKWNASPSTGSHQVCPVVSLVSWGRFPGRIGSVVMV